MQSRNQSYFSPKYPKICFRCINDSSVNTGISNDKEGIIVYTISWAKRAGLTKHGLKDRNQRRKDQEICMNIFKIFSMSKTKLVTIRALKKIRKHNFTINK